MYNNLGLRKFISEYTEIVNNDSTNNQNITFVQTCKIQSYLIKY